jgi:intracellular sulfur oxidation DsrE/DsrF family protein
MKNYLKNLIWAGILVLCCFQSVVAAEEYKNSRALRQVRVAKAYFDVTNGSPGKLVNQLGFIDKAYEQLAKAGLKPQFVLGFHSAASAYVTKGSEDYVTSDEEIAAKKKVQAWVQRFKAKGIVMEQCMLAAEVYEIEADDILPEIDRVKNGYVSTIGYQAKGYSLVPVN